jgi:tRNA wybutosine-synthesizing protein 1
VPWHAEVRAWCEALSARLGGRYGLAAEHAHSCCVLLARADFRVDGAWHTHIDFDRFHELAARFYESGQPFAAADYTAPTPDWAVYGAPEGGFDPEETRWRRKGAGGGCVTGAEADHVDE